MYEAERLMMTDGDVSRLQVVHIQSCVFWNVTSRTPAGRALLRRLVSGWPPWQPRSSLVGSVVDSSTGAGFLRVLQLHLPHIQSIKCPTIITIHLLELVQQANKWRMVSSGMLRRVALVRTDVSEELSAFFIRVTRIGELGTTLTVTSNRRTLRRNTKPPWWRVP
jgi:hypothetical protein